MDDENYPQTIAKRKDNSKEFCGLKIKSRGVNFSVVEAFLRTREREKENEKEQKLKVRK